MEHRGLWGGLCATFSVGCFGGALAVWLAAAAVTPPNHIPLWPVYPLAAGGLLALVMAFAPVFQWWPYRPLVTPRTRGLEDLFKYEDWTPGASNAIDNKLPCVGLELMAPHWLPLPDRRSPTPYTATLLVRDADERTWGPIAITSTFSAPRSVRFVVAFPQAFSTETLRDVLDGQFQSEWDLDGKHYQGRFVVDEYGNVLPPPQTWYQRTRRKVRAWAARLNRGFPEHPVTQ